MLPIVARLILSERRPDRTRFVGQPVRQLSELAFEAAGGAKPGTDTPCDACGLGGRHVAARDRRQDRAQNLPSILRIPQRRQVDAETLGRIDGGEGRRQELRGEGK